MNQLIICFDMYVAILFGHLFLLLYNLLAIRMFLCSLYKNRMFWFENSKSDFTCDTCDKLFCVSNIRNFNPFLDFDLYLIHDILLVTLSLSCITSLFLETSPEMSPLQADNKALIYAPINYSLTHFHKRGTF